MLRPHSSNFQDAPKDIIQDKSPEIADMCRAIHCGSTAVKTKDPAIGWLQYAHLARHGIEQTHAVL